MKILKLKQQQQNPFNMSGLNNKTASAFDLGNKKKKNNSVSSNIKAKMIKNENEN